MNFPQHRTVYIGDVIEKRRKLNTGESQAQPTTMSISEEMKKNIESTFQEQIKQLIKDSKSLSNMTPTIDSESILAENNSAIQKIPCYTKKYEESMMRPAQSQEEKCINGENCECILISKTDPTAKGKGFIGVSLPERHKMCVLCVRKKVSQQYYHYLITNTSPETCIQPHYNIVEKPEEYNKDCVFLPTSMTGITDPFVMHRRHNYKYQDGRIVQSSSVNFTQASMMCEQKTIFITRNDFHTKPLKLTEAQYFDKINKTTDFKKKYYLEMNLYLNIPVIFDGKKSILWEQIVTTILDASVFLPIIFGQKIVNDKITKNIPIVHIISKGLPQRSQFRNFLTISLDCLKKSAEFKIFFKQLFVWSIIGIHYRWNKICLPLYKRLQLFELCCVQESDWEKILTVNVRLFFFMIKEYLCFVIKQNPGLHNILVKTTDWIKYETEIFNVMNEVRHIFATSENNPLKQMLNLTQKLLPRPNIVNWPKLHNNQQIPSKQQLYMFLQKKGFKPEISVKLETLCQYKKHLQTLKLELRTYDRLNEVIEKVELWESPNLEELIKEVSTKQWKQFYNMVFIEKVLNSIRQIKLPIHQVENQLNASIKRHDLNTSDVNFVSTLYNATTFYFCIGCEVSFFAFGFFPIKTISNILFSQDVKAAYDYGQKKKENTIFSYGHNKLALDPYCGKTYCMGTNTRRKQKETSCMAVPCLKISLFGKIVSFFGKSFVLCSLCGTLCSLRMNKCFLKKGMIACGNCHQQTDEQEFCGYCVRKSSSLVKYRIYDDENQEKFQNPWSTIWLCPRHRNNHWGQDKILLKSSLFYNLREKI